MTGRTTRGRTHPSGPARIRALRIAALPVAATGLGLHLWLGTKVGLGVAAAGVAAHLAAAVLGRRWLRRRNRPWAGGT